MKNNYFSAKEAARIAQKAHADAVKEQMDSMFYTIAKTAREQKYSLKLTATELYPEVQQTLREYGYGVVCPDDGGKCWEVSWDSSSTPVQGADSRRWNN